jgi:hypothetical protein
MTGMKVTEPLARCSFGWAAAGAYYRWADAAAARTVSLDADRQ